MAYSRGSGRKYRNISSAQNRNTSIYCQTYSSAKSMSCLIQGRWCYFILSRNHQVGNQIFSQARTFIQRLCGSVTAERVFSLTTFITCIDKNVVPSTKTSRRRWTASTNLVTFKSLPSFGDDDDDDDGDQDESFSCQLIDFKSCSRKGRFVKHPLLTFTSKWKLLRSLDTEWGCAWQTWVSYYKLWRSLLL